MIDQNKIEYYKSIINEVKEIEQNYYLGETAYTKEAVEEMVQAANRLQENLDIILGGHYHDSTGNN